MVDGSGTGMHDDAVPQKKSMLQSGPNYKGTYETNLCERGVKLLPCYLCDSHQNSTTWSWENRANTSLVGRVRVPAEALERQ
jgi:hypothetical protein